jgi:hypothetical protein
MTMRHCQQKLPILSHFNFIRNRYSTFFESRVPIGFSKETQSGCASNTPIESSMNFTIYCDQVYSSSCILNKSAKTTPEFQRPILNVVSISGSKERRRGYIVDIFVSALSNYGRFYGRLRLPGVVVQRYQLSYCFRGKH